MTYRDSLIELVGATPLVRLRRVAEGLRPTVLAKLEYLNPGGSVKDRIALAMVEAAERDGRLRPGGTIVEPTSGNTGVGLAMVAAARGYRCLFTCPDKVTTEKIDLLRAYGATVVVCPAAVPFDHPDFYRNTARRLAAETPGGCLLDQYANPANPLAHYQSTGPELWQQTGGRITHFVAGMGTGGTISGVGRYLKEVSGGRVRVIGVDPEGSIYTGDQVRPYLLEGVGQPTLPGAYDPSAPDELLSVPDSTAFAMARRLAREEAMLVGGSGGMAVAAAIDVAGRLGPDDTLVVIIPDSGRNYLSKVFNPDWMAARGFTAESPDLLSASGELVSISPQETVGAAVAALHKHRLPALPVISAPAPVRLAEVLGTASQRDLAEALAFGRAYPTDPVREHMSAPPPFVGTGESLSSALARLGPARFAIVLDGGLVRGLLYDHDIAAYLARMERT